MALSHTRSYQRSAFATNFLRPSLYISGDASSVSEQHAIEENVSNAVWREVYESIVAHPDSFALSTKSNDCDQEKGSRRGSIMPVQSTTVHQPCSISITRQLAFGKWDEEEIRKKRKFGCDFECDATCFVMLVSVTLVCLCFAGVLVLRIKEMELDKRLLDDWLKKESENRSSILHSMTNSTSISLEKSLNEDETKNGNVRNLL